MKGDYLFSASSFRNVILQKVIARWSKKIFYSMKIDIEDIKSYPNVSEWTKLSYLLPTNLKSKLVHRYVKIQIFL